MLRYRGAIKIELSEIKGPSNNQNNKNGQLRNFSQLRNKTMLSSFSSSLIPI